jgi:hypothetical protein
MNFTTVLSNVTNCVFNPELKSEKKIIAFLQSIPTNSAHPYGENIIANIDGIIHKILKSTDPKIYQTCLDTEKSERDLCLMLRETQQGLLAGYSIDFQLSGTRLTPIDIDKPIFGALTDKTIGSYFDLVAYCKSVTLKTLSYNSNKANKMYNK